MKRIKYQVAGYLQEYNADTDSIEKKATLLSVDVPFSEAGEETAKKEAYNGEYEIYDDGQPEAPSGDASDVWDELDAAYQAGYDEGYTEGVNSAYDQ